SQTVNASPITMASTNISADAITGTFTNLTGPVYQEPITTAVQPGNITLDAPAGFVFDTGGVAPTVLLNGGSNSGRNINNLADGSTIAVTVTSSNLTINIS